MNLYWQIDFKFYFSPANEAIGDRNIVVDVIISTNFYRLSDNNLLRTSQFFCMHIEHVFYFFYNY